MEMMYFADNPWEFFKDPSGWLYAPWSEKRYNWFLAMYSTPLRYPIDYFLDKRKTSEYLDRYGMDYSDIHDPRKLSTTSSGSAMIGYGQRMVSKNINKLYS